MHHVQPERIAPAQVLAHDRVAFSRHARGAREIDASRQSPGVQRPEQIERDLARRLDALHAVADRIYARWLEGISRGS
mgnify:CR=1 FL=1